MAMKKRDREAIFVEHVKKGLEQSVDDMDGKTLSRLAGLRREALERKRQRRYRIPRWMRVPAAGLAAAAVALLAFTTVVKETSPPLGEQILADVDILSSREVMEFYENLDFYLWLAEQQDGTG
jgi:hypothetical protein